MNNIFYIYLAINKNMWLGGFDDEKLEKGELLTKNDLMEDSECDGNDAIIFSIREDWEVSESIITVYKRHKSENEYYIEIIDNNLRGGTYKQQFDIVYETEDIIGIIKDNMEMLKGIGEFEVIGVDGIFTEIYFSDLVKCVYFSYGIVNKDCKDFKQLIKVSNKIKRIIKKVKSNYDPKVSKDLLKY